MDAGKHRFLGLALFFAALLTGLSGCAVHRNSAGDFPARILVYTVSAGYVHQVARRPSPGEPSLVEASFQKWAAEDPRFEVVVSRDAGMFTPEKLAGFDAVFFYTTGELPIPEEGRRALIDFVRQGGGFAGAHCAADTLYKDPGYGRMLGAWFDGHPWHQEVQVIVEDRLHPATRHLEGEFRITDEIYQFGPPYDRRRLHVLLRLDVDSVNLKVPGVHRTDRDFALAWTRREGRGRVFYTALGHPGEVWKDPRFKDLLVEGVLWAAGGKAGPSR
ncbi:MAG: ThuA domain-containing protein [Planctomycetota bacterium]